MSLSDVQLHVDGIGPSRAYPIVDLSSFRLPLPLQLAMGIASMLVTWPYPLTILIANL